MTDEFLEELQSSWRRLRSLYPSDFEPQAEQKRSRN